MDEFQKRVHDDLPKFTFKTGLITLILSAIFWGILFMVLHFLVIVPFWTSTRKTFSSARYFLEMKPKDQKWYTSHIHAIFHAIFSMFGSIYCFIYADGQ